MSMEGGPSGSYYEGPTAVDQLEMARVKREIAQAIEAASVEEGAREINRDPMLEALLAKIIEGGAELDPYTLSHLKKWSPCGSAT